MTICWCDNGVERCPYHLNPAILGVCERWHLTEASNIIKGLTIKEKRVFVKACCELYVDYCQHMGGTCFKTKRPIPIENKYDHVIAVERAEMISNVYKYSQQYPASKDKLPNNTKQYARYTKVTLKYWDNYT